MLRVTGILAVKPRTDDKFIHILPNDGGFESDDFTEKIVMRYPLFENETGRYPARWLAQRSRDELDASRVQARMWAEEAKEAARHSWDGYRQKAWVHDQIHPQ